MTEILKCDHVVYAIHFDDKRIKVGVTSNIQKRLRYYVQEARRNRVEGLTWWASSPAPKSLAYLIERHFCRRNKAIAMPSHREWFDGVSYASILAALENMRGQCAEALGEHPADVPYAGSSGRAAAWGTA